MIPTSTQQAQLLCFASVGCLDLSTITLKLHHIYKTMKCKAKEQIHQEQGWPHLQPCSCHWISLITKCLFSNIQQSICYVVDFPLKFIKMNCCNENAFKISFLVLLVYKAEKHYSEMFQVLKQISEAEVKVILKLLPIVTILFDTNSICIFQKATLHSLSFQGRWQQSRS